MYSLPFLSLKNLTRTKLLDYFENTWLLTEVLFSGLKPDAFYETPYHKLRQPLIFYYIHPAVLYVNKFLMAGIIQNPINAEFENKFLLGVDEMSWDELITDIKSLPTLEQAIDYRKQVYKLIKNIIQSHPDLENPIITLSHPFWALLMAMEHERLHLETSSVLIRELPIDCVKKPQQWPAHFPLSQNKQKPNRFIDVPTQQVTIGKPIDHPSYSWDNEYGKKDTQVNTFKAQQCLVSNGEYFEFVACGAYQQEKYWSKEGWQWRLFRNTKHPPFWFPIAADERHEYQLRLCFELIPMQWDWPVEVNYHEAKAYCAWKTLQDKSQTTYRLISEAEHHCLRSLAAYGDDEYNHHLKYGSVRPNHFHITEGKFCDVFGNLWQWTDDHFFPLPGFEPHPLYLDFSKPFFDDLHYLLMGGSFATTGGFTSPFARNEFRPHFMQHAGFRMAFDISDPSIK